MLPSWCRESVTVLRAPQASSRGTRVRDWSSAGRHVVRGCSLQPGATSTAWGDPRQTSTVRATLYAPPGADIEDGDRVTVDGHDYCVDGAPVSVRSPTGAASHVVCNLVDGRG